MYMRRDTFTFFLSFWKCAQGDATTICAASLGGRRFHTKEKDRLIHQPYSLSYFASFLCLVTSQLHRRRFTRHAKSRIDRVLSHKLCNTVLILSHLQTAVCTNRQADNELIKWMCLVPKYNLTDKKLIPWNMNLNNSHKNVFTNSNK